MSQCASLPALRAAGPVDVAAVPDEMDDNPSRPGVPSVDHTVVTYAKLAHTPPLAGQYLSPDLIRVLGEPSELSDDTIRNGRIQAAEIVFRRRG